MGIRRLPKHQYGHARGLPTGVSLQPTDESLDRCVCMFGDHVL